MPARPQKRAKLTRLGLAPPLTLSEVRELKARAAADLRTISNYVSYLVAEDLKRMDRRRAAAGANPGKKRKRKPYAIALYLTAQERKRLEARAKAERRSLSGYVARVIAAELGH